MSTLKRTLAAAFLFLMGGATPGIAGQISTPIIFQSGGDQVVCIANNVSTLTITVTVRIIGLVGGQVQQTCTLAPGNRNGCQAFKPNDGGQCRILVNNLTDDDVRRHIRGVFFARRITAPFATFSVVEAR